jgi:AAA family ATP:ADP antiporter
VRLSARTNQFTLITGTILLFMGGGMFLWWASRHSWHPLSILYYIWANTSGVILTAQVWTLATSLFPTNQARRMFPVMCSGGILGSTLGGMFAAAEAKRMGTNNLIVVPVILLAGCLCIVEILRQLYRKSSRSLRLRNRPSKRQTRVGDVLRITVRTRYLRLIASLLSLSAIVTLIVDFQFKIIIQQVYQDRDVLTAFFGSFYAYVGCFSFVLQLFAGSRIFNRFGLRVALLFLPMTLLGGTVALLAYPAMLWTGLFLKGSDGILRTSIDKSTMEMLYIPVPQSLKVQVKAVIDVMISRFSDGAGGVLLLALTQLLGFGLYGVGVVNGILLILWIWVARETRQEYQHTLEKTAPTPSRQTVTVESEAA